MITLVSGMAVVRSGFDLTKFSPMPILTVVDPFGIVDVYHLPYHPFVSCNSKSRKRRLGSSIRTAETGSSSSLTATCRDLRSPLLIMNVLYFFVHITYLYNLVRLWYPSFWTTELGVSHCNCCLRELLLQSFSPRRPYSQMLKRRQEGPLEQVLWNSAIKGG